MCLVIYAFTSPHSYYCIRRLVIHGRSVWCTWSVFDSHDAKLGNNDRNGNTAFAFRCLWLSPRAVAFIHCSAVREEWISACHLRSSTRFDYSVTLEDHCWWQLGDTIMARNRRYGAVLLCDEGDRGFYSGNH